MADPISAPGAPGIRPTWTSSDKDVVTTALGVSRVWVTLGHGVLNEIYWPETGDPQVRDLGFIVAGASGWFEVKRVNRYRTSLPEPYIPLPHIAHEGDGYRLVLEVAPDPTRDVVVISYRLVGEGLRLYAMLAPHLNNAGEGNNARAGKDLAAWKDSSALCLAADVGFSRSSAGYVGTSDGWQDFDRNGRMTWSYLEALEGNVALIGELGANEGTLALGFSTTIVGARTKARSSLSEGYEAIRNRFIAGWQDWGKTLDIPEAPADIRREAYLSSAVLKVHAGRSYPGSIVASLSVPWGNATNSSGGYHLVWARDCVEAGLALFAAGQIEDARSMLSYLVATQNDDGSWNQNSFPDGRPFWGGVQLDEVAFPVILATKLSEANHLRGMSGVRPMVERAVGYLARNGPISPQDRWEENAGISPFTLAVQIAALVAGAVEWLEGEQRDYALALADYWNERIEDWTYVVGGALAAEHSVEGYYVRIGPPAAQGGLRGRVNVANRAGETLPATAMVGMEYLHLVRLGLRSAEDQRIVDTLKVTEAMLKVVTPSGVAYHRYNNDGYGEHADGSPYDGNGVGRAWPLLTGERGHFELQRGSDPMPYLDMMARMTGAAGLIPEQVWDGPAIPERGLAPGKPTGGAMPLVWAHAEFLKLLYACREKRPIELLICVEAHMRRRPVTGIWHWCIESPFDVLPHDRDLLIETSEPFRLHLGFDGWQRVEDRPSSPLPFGRHGVRLTRDELGATAVVVFTMYFIAAARWQGIDYQIRLERERSG